MNTILVSKFYAIKHETGIEEVTESDRLKEMALLIGMGKV